MFARTTSHTEIKSFASSPKDPEQSKSDRNFLARASLIFLGVSVLGLLASLLSFNLNNLKNWLVVLALVLVGASCAGAWFSANKKKLLLSAWLLVITLTSANTFLFLAGSDASFLETLAVFSLIALFSMIVLSSRVAYTVILWGNLVTIFLWVTNGILINKSGDGGVHKMGADDLTLLIVVQLVTIWLANYLVGRLKKANETTRLQAAQLAEALSDLERKRSLGEETGRQVLSLGAQLAAVASQQAGGSKEQATALAEVISYNEELTQTSRLIAGEAASLQEQVQAISSSSERARVAAFEVKQLGENSAGAVEKTTAQNQQVDELYQELGNLLTELNQSQVEMKKVVELISGLGSETHLLSLNAALEAASAGEYGDRFEVVAAEVKELADRSIQASREVARLLGFVENRIDRAAGVAQRGNHQTRAALAVARESGQIMRQLVRIIEQNEIEMEGIEKAASLMEAQAREISYATGQQYVASTQGLEKLQVIGGVATQTASTSAQVSSSTHALEKLAEHLLQSLR